VPPARAVRPADAARARSELAEIGEVRWQPAAGGRRESLRSAGETALQALRGTLGRNSREARVARLPTSMEPPDDGGLCVICLEGAAERSPRDAPAPGGNVHGRAVRGRWQSEAELYRGPAERPAPSRRASARELGGALLSRLSDRMLFARDADKVLWKVLPCKHRFHQACIDDWLLRPGGACPICRVDPTALAAGAPLATDEPGAGGSAAVHVLAWSPPVGAGGPGGADGAGGASAVAALPLGSGEGPRSAAGEASVEQQRLQGLRGLRGIQGLQAALPGAVEESVWGAADGGAGAGEGAGGADAARAP
jgi:hypothetical protein